jgi:hypothetical protein
MLRHLLLEELTPFAFGDNFYLVILCREPVESMSESFACTGAS